MYGFWKKSAIVAVVLALAPLLANAFISRNLKLGDRGEDVRELQVILNKDADTRVAIVGPGSPGNETVYFGVLTKLAVIKFQEKYAADILTPVSLTRGTGFVGAQTRIFLLRLAGGSVVAPTPTAAPQTPIYFESPVITSISPSVVIKSTTELTITGFNFTPTGNAVIVSSEDPAAFTNISSSDGKTIKFNFHFATADALKAQFAPMVTSGKYAAIMASVAKNISGRASATGNAQIPVRISVRNSNGESVATQILIDITEILKEIGQQPQ